MYIYLCTTLRGQIKGQCRAIFLIISLQPGQYIIAQERTRAIYILPGKVVSLIHTLIFRMLHKKLAIIYIVELVTFTCGMEFCILTIIKNAIIFIVVDTYE